MMSFNIRALAIGALFAMLTPPVAADAPFDAAQRSQILEGISRDLNGYIFPDVAVKIRSDLTTNRDRLLAIADPAQFAKAVSDELHAVGNDKHLNLIYSADILAPDADPTPAEIAHEREATNLHNAGVHGVEWLPGNIGYIRIAGFPPDSADVRHAIDAAMATVAHTDALIIDLRHNGGGDPSSLDYWMGYFFEKPTELTSIRWTAPKPHVDRQFSAAKIGGSRYLKPIYVLTSARTFSCAEQFTYDLKALHRATIVGETTGGGANPGDFHRLTDHFAVFIPTAQAYNPYTKTNWEHTGITPDAASSAADALVSGYTLALKNDTNSFDELVIERKNVLEDPGAALKRIFTP
jgi:retinol-binding protein 3